MTLREAAEAERRRRQAEDADAGKAERERAAAVATAHVVLAEVMTAHDGVLALDPATQTTTDQVDLDRDVVALTATDGSGLSFMVFVRDRSVFLGRLEPEGWVRVAPVRGLASLGDVLASVDLATDRY